MSPSMRPSEQPQEALGRAIQQLRHKLGLTQEITALRAGLTARSLSAIETGKANPTWATVRDLAAVLDVPVSELAKAAERLER